MTESLYKKTREINFCFGAKLIAAWFVILAQEFATLGVNNY